MKKLTHSRARTHTRGAHEEGPTGEQRGWGGEEETEKVSNEIKEGEAVRKNKDAALYTHTGETKYASSKGEHAGERAARAINKVSRQGLNRQSI